MAPIDYAHRNLDKSWHSGCKRLKTSCNVFPVFDLRIEDRQTDSGPQLVGWDPQMSPWPVLGDPWSTL